MAMQYIESYLRRLGEHDLAEDIALKRRQFVRKGHGKDIPLPNVETVEAPERVIAPRLEASKDIFDSEGLLKLQQAIAELRKGSTPETVTNYWREKLKIDGARAGLSIDVSDCDWTEEEIQKPMVDIEGNPVVPMMVYKPEQLKGTQGLILLGEMYPRMESYSIREDTPIRDTHETTGWIKVEATIGARNRSTRQKDLEDFAKKQGYLGQREGTYILASQASKDLTGQYFDQGGDTWSRLLGSRDGGYVIYADFDSDGDLRVDWNLSPTSGNPGLGARFEEVKKT